MFRKFRWAGAVALVGTLLSAVVAAHASGAAAETIAPRILLPETATSFISLPVVQPLPAAARAEGATEDNGSRPDNDAAPDTLRELVEDQPVTAELSPELRCLAGAIYFEARGESLAGQLAVGRVIVNRAASGRFPPSYCGVVFQPEQFSFVRGRTMPAVATASAAWRQAVAIARIAHEGAWQSSVPGALYFHAARVAPRWRLVRLARVDNHVFYR